MFLLHYATDKVQGYYLIYAQDEFEAENKLRAKLYDLYGATITNHTLK